MALTAIVTNTNLEEDACFGAVIESRDMIVARTIAHEGRLRLAETPYLRRDQFMFAHEGAVEDVGTLRRRISPRRAFQIATNTDADSFFAYLLTRIDGTGDADTGLLRATSDIASSGLRGNFGFLLATEQAVYVHGAGRARLGFAERTDALIASTELVETARWRLLGAGALVRLDRGTSLAWRILRGDIEPSEPELPFTD